VKPCAYWLRPPVAQWATFPLLLLAFQAGDIRALLDNRTVGATLHGADRLEKARGPASAAKLRFLEAGKDY